MQSPPEGNVQLVPYVHKKGSRALHCTGAEGELKLRQSEVQTAPLVPSNKAGKMFAKERGVKRTSHREAEERRLAGYTERPANV